MNPAKNRVVRVPDELWDAAQAKAKSEGKQLSTVIRRLLSQYARS
jgi:hypothetical protein